MGTCYPNGTPPSFPECNGDVWCVAVNQTRANPPAGSSPAFVELVFKAFGSMGIRAYDGTPKAGLSDIWQRFLALPRL
jgi:hypothetical protein